MELAHRRFTVNYLEGVLGDEVRELWAVVAGLTDARESSLRLGVEIDAAQGSPERREAAAASAKFAELVERVLREGRLRPEEGVRIWAWIALLEEEDGQFLAGLKETLRQGLRAFEQHEGAAPRTAGRRLVAALEEIPKLVRAYCSRFASGARWIEAAAARAGTERA